MTRMFDAFTKAKVSPDQLRSPLVKQLIAGMQRHDARQRAKERMRAEKRAAGGSNAA
jgi:hypothetical protein